MTNYQNLTIIISKYPDLIQLPDSRWNRVFDVRFKKSIDVNLDLSKIAHSVSNQDFLVKINKQNKTSVKVSVTTDRWGWDDEISIGTSILIKKLDDLIGTIDIIQGQARSEWCSWLWNITE